MMKHEAQEEEEEMVVSIKEEAPPEDTSSQQDEELADLHFVQVNHCISVLIISISFV